MGPHHLDPVKPTLRSLKHQMASKGILLPLFGATLLFVFLNAEGTDDIIDAEIANLKKLKAFLHGKTDQEVLSLIDEDGNGGISKEELRDFLHTLHLQQVMPAKLGAVEMNAIWKALAGDNNEVHMEDLAKYVDDNSLARRGNFAHEADDEEETRILPLAILFIYLSIVASLPNFNVVFK